MKRITLLVTLTLAVLFGGPAHAQKAGETVTFGNRLSVPAIVNALQNGGYQALLSPPNPSAQPSAVMGTITTGLNGIKIVLLLQKCQNRQDDQVCFITFLASFTDTKNIMTKDLAYKLNETAFMSKVMLQKRPDGTSGFSIVYTYPCIDFEDTKFVNMMLMSFGADVSKIGNAYNTSTAAQ